MSLDPAQVAAVLVTRGDIDLAPIIETLPYGELVVWDNSSRPYDAKVFGRYLGIAEAKAPVIYFQDDDCIVRCHRELLDAYEPGVVVGNAIDDPVRLAKYHDTTLLGWGALFDRDMPFDAFQRFERIYPDPDQDFFFGLGAEVVFPMLSRTKTILGGIEWLEQDGEQVQMRKDRMWRQPGFYRDLDHWLAKARDARDRLAAG